MIDEVYVLLIHYCGKPHHPKRNYIQTKSRGV